MLGCKYHKFECSHINNSLVCDTYRLPVTSIFKECKKLLIDMLSDIHLINVKVSNPDKLYKFGINTKHKSNKGV